MKLQEILLPEIRTQNWEVANTRFYHNRIPLDSYLFEWCHQKRRGGDFEMKIPNILNASSTRFSGNFQGAERRLQQILLLNLNLSSQTNFIILALWIKPLLISFQGAN
jgi:hypothetical protein